jgi:hypothetical protein
VLVHPVLKASGVVGRITERELPLAEESFPGISRFYKSLSAKPMTFLQLVWAFEATQAARPTRRKQRS